MKDIPDPVLEACLLIPTALIVFSMIGYAYLFVAAVTGG